MQSTRVPLLKKEGGDEPGCVCAVVHDKVTAVVWFLLGGEVCVDVGRGEREEASKGERPKQEGRWA
jgi:hypothetical protein